MYRPPFSVRSVCRFVLGFLALGYGAAVVPCVGGADRTATVDLTARRVSGQCTRVTIVYEVAGSLTLGDQEQPTEVPLAVTARATYDERLLGVAAGAAEEGEPGWPRQSARYYHQHDAKLLINGQEILPILRQDRRLCGASFSERGLVIFSPQGPLSREELDLVQWPGDSLLADALLPTTRVPLGATWQVDKSLLGALLNIETVGQSNVSGKLIETNREYAQVDAQGVVHGTVDGTTTTIEVKARCYFDLRRQHVRSLQLVAKEKRSPGEVTPGVDAVAKVSVQCEPLSRADRLADRVVATMAGEPSADAMRLSFAPRNRFYHLLHDRQWHVTSDGKSVVVLRYLQAGDVVGQCNISVLPVIEKGKQVTLEAFRDDVRSTLGKSFGRFVKASEYVDPGGRLVYQVEVVGKVTEVPIRWRYYLIGEADGRRAALIFTLEESQTARFDQADRRFLSGFDFPAADQTAKGQPASADQVRDQGSESPPPGPLATRRERGGSGSMSRR